MSSLLKLQHDMQNILLHSKPPSGFSKKIMIYHHNIFLKLTKILENIYLTISIITGKKFFNAVAKEYIQQFPPQCSGLHPFGLYFSLFLKKFPPAQSLDYLPDMANLSWAHYEAAFEKNAEISNLMQLHSISENHYDKIKFILNPAIRLVTSRYPILEIWKLCLKKLRHQKLYTLDLNNTEPSDFILISRPYNEVIFEKLSPSEFAFLSAFKQNLNLRQASLLALKADPSFNGEITLKKHLLSNNIVGFSL